MSEYNQLVLDASNATQVSAPIDCDRVANMFLGLTVESTTPNLNAQLLLTCGLDLLNPPASMPVMNFGLTLSVIPAGITYTPGTGIIAIASPAAGRNDVVLRMASPPRFIRANYTYNSGGGTVRVRLRAWGWKSM